MVFNWECIFHNFKLNVFSFCILFILLYILPHYLQVGLGLHNSDFNCDLFTILSINNLIFDKLFQL